MTSLQKLTSLAAIALVAIGLAGCGDDGSTTETDASGSDANTPQDAGDSFDVPATDARTSDAIGTDTESPPGELRLSVGPLTAARGEENTECVTLNLRNPEPVWVSAVHARLTPGSHHMIVYRSTDETESPVPSPCTPFISAGMRDNAPLVIAEKPDTTVEYPEGAALRLDANQMIRLEIHYINYVSDDPIDVTGTVWFDEYDGDPGEVAEVEILFDGPLSLSVPARSESQTNHFTSIGGSEERPIHVFAVTTHTHQWGVLNTIHRSTGVSDEGTMLHESRDWAEPPLDTFSPPLEFTGGDGLRLTCNYNNLSDRNIGFGLGFEDEMCFLWAYMFRP